MTNLKEDLKKIYARSPARQEDLDEILTTQSYLVCLAFHEVLTMLAKNPTPDQLKALAAVYEAQAEKILSTADPELRQQMEELLK